MTDNNRAQNPSSDAPTTHVDATVHGGEGQGHVPTLAVPGTGRRIGIAAVVLVLALAAVFAFRLATHRKDRAQLAGETAAAAAAPPAVDVVRVGRAGQSRTLTLPGEVRALHETTIYARTSGYLKGFTVDIGDTVRKNGEMAVIETPELDDQLTAAEAKVKQVQSDVELAKSNVRYAQQSFDRWNAAAPAGAVSAQDRDQKAAELDTSKARQHAAEAALELARAEAKRLQTLAGFKTVTAPFTGTVTQRHVDLGDLVTAGSTTSTTPLFSIAQSDWVRVVTDVPQSAAPEIVRKMGAKVTVGEHRGRTFPGTVERTADALDPVSRTLRVEVWVDNASGALKPGSYAMVEFEADRASPPVQIPAAALVQRPTGPQVAVVADDGTVRFQPIEIARDLGDVIEVGGGLSDGQRVAMNISSDVADGDRVAAHQVDPAVPPPTKAAPAHAAGPTTAPAAGAPAAHHAMAG